MNFNYNMFSKDRKHNQTPYSKITPCHPGLNRIHDPSRNIITNNCQEMIKLNGNYHSLNESLGMDYELEQNEQQQQQHVIPKYPSSTLSNMFYNPMQSEPNDLDCLEIQLPYFSSSSTFPQRRNNFHQTYSQQLRPPRQMTVSNLNTNPSNICEKSFIMPTDSNVPNFQNRISTPNITPVTPKKQIRQTTLTSYGYISPKVVINNAREKASLAKNVDSNPTYMNNNFHENINPYFQQQNRPSFNSDLSICVNTNSNNYSPEIVSKYFQKKSNSTVTSTTALHHDKTNLTSNMSQNAFHKQNLTNTNNLNEIAFQRNTKEFTMINSSENLPKKYSIHTKSSSTISYEDQIQKTTEKSENKANIYRKSSLRVLSGPIEKILRWATKKDILEMLFEVIAPLVAIRSGLKNKERILLLQDCAGAPSLICVFYEIDRTLPELKTGSLVRCIGKMVSSNRMLCFSIRESTNPERTAIKRLQFNCNRAFQDGLQETSSKS